MGPGEHLQPCAGDQRGNAAEVDRAGPRDRRVRPPRAPECAGRPRASAFASLRSQPSSAATWALTVLAGTRKSSGIAPLSDAVSRRSRKARPAARPAAVRGYSTLSTAASEGSGSLSMRWSAARAEHRRRAAGIGAREYQPAHPAGVTDRQLLGDEAAHRPAEDIGAAEADRIHQPGGTVGERREGGARDRRPREADAGIVEHDHAVMAGQALDERGVPLGHRRAGADGHHQRRAGSALVPGDPSVADLRDVDLGRGGIGARVPGRGETGRGGGPPQDPDGGPNPSAEVSVVFKKSLRDAHYRWLYPPFGG